MSKGAKSSNSGKNSRLANKRSNDATQTMQLKTQASILPEVMMASGGIIIANKYFIPQAGFSN